MLTIRFARSQRQLFFKNETQNRKEKRGEEEEEEAENECPTAANDLVAQTVVQLSSAQILLPFTINSIRPMLLRSSLLYLLYLPLLEAPLTGNQSCK